MKHLPPCCCFSSDPVYYLHLSFFLLIVVEAVFSSDDFASNLKQVHIIYRHGDRAPLVNIAEAGYRSEDWPDGLGELTNRGIEQQYSLGKELRLRYSGFISDCRKQVYVRSTDHNRTLQSAQTNIAGMFPPIGNLSWNGGDLGKLWRPFPVHSVPQSDEFMLKPTAKCSKLQNLNEDLYKEPLSIALEDKNQALADLLQKHASTAGKTFWFRILNLHDTSVALEEHNLTLPVWANMTVRESIRELADTLFWLWVGGNGHLDRARLVAGSLLHTIVTRLQNAENDPVKMYIYSGHDSTIAGLLSILHLGTDGSHESEFFPIPPYNSVIIVEQFKNDTLRFTYKNGSEYHPVDLHHEKCQKNTCQLEVFVEITKDRVVPDWRSECENTSLLQNVADHLPTSGFWAITAVLGLFIGLVLVMKWRKQRRENKEAGPLPSVSTSDTSISYRSLENQNF